MVTSRMSRDSDKRSKRVHALPSRDQMSVRCTSYLYADIFRSAKNDG